MQRFAKAAVITGVIIMASMLGALFGGFGEKGEGNRDSAPLSVNCGQRVSGAERTIELSREGIVSCEHSTVHIEVDGDGMTEFEDVFTFAGIAPGNVCATIYDHLPWHEGYNPKGFVDRHVFLHVNEKLRVSTFDAFEFEKIELVESGTMAQARYYVAELVDGIVRMNAYEALPGEEPPTEGEFKDCYVQIVELLDAHDAKNWDGYYKSNPHVLDGSSFDLTITRRDGTTLRAHGTNIAPGGFREFENAFCRLFASS